MRVELENYLIKKFPKLYSEYGEQQPFTEFGFECDDGWFRLILWLSRYLQDYIDQQNKWSEKYPDQYLPVKQIKVVQVKEKFAGLRLYIDGRDAYIDGVVALAESLSYSICEQCGSNENVDQNKKGWSITLCEKCRKIIDKKINKH